MRQLIEQMFVATFDPDGLGDGGDAADLGHITGRVALTTDSFVVRPRVFPGGDIGRLAVFGTVNDLAMAGARPRALTLSLVIEEGLAMSELWETVCSIAGAAREAGVSIVTGDTKVVERGAADGLFVNTAGVGEIPDGRRVAPDRISAGDAVIVSGDIGRHGIAVMSARGDLGVDVDVESDCAALHEAVEALFAAGVGLVCLRDATRGGMAAALHELASASATTISLVEEQIPVRTDVRAACELLGLDAMHVACEGRFVAVLDPKHVARAIDALQHFGTAAAHVGSVITRDVAPLQMQTRFGVRVVVDLPAGEQLPRIC